MYDVLKLLSLLFAIWFSEVNIMKAFREEPISKINFFIQSSSIAIFIFLQWLI
jgi:hypothetical protein